MDYWIIYLLIFIYMKRVKCIKDTVGFTKGQIFQEDEKGFIWDHLREIQCYWRTYGGIEEYFQEIKEETENKPRWKVGDKVVKLYRNYESDYITIFLLGLSEGKWTYNGYGEEDLRDPTPEELEKYFR